MAGRPPKPTKTKILQGTFRPCRAVNEPEPEELVAVPRPPKSLKGYKRARAEWTRAARELIANGILTNLDLVTLESYCLAYERMLTAEDALRDGMGLTMETPNGYQQERPEVSIASKSRKEVLSFAGVLGLTPAHRSRLNVAKPKEKTADPMEELLRGRA